MLLTSVLILIQLYYIYSTKNYKRQLHEDLKTNNKILRIDNYCPVSYNNCNKTIIDNGIGSLSETPVLGEKELSVCRSNARNHDQIKLEEIFRISNVSPDITSKSVLNPSCTNAENAITYSDLLNNTDPPNGSHLFTSYLEDFDLSFLESNNIQEFQPKGETYVIFDLDKQVFIEQYREENKFGNISLNKDKEPVLFGQNIMNSKHIGETNRIELHVEACKTVWMNHFELLKVDVEQYIKTHISNKKHLKKYLKRFNKITDTIKLFNTYQHELYKLSSLFNTNDHKLVEVLIIMRKKFANDTTFDQEARLSFEKDFYSCVNEISQIHNGICYTLTDEEKILVFYLQFLRLYNNVYDMPEILTLGGLYTNKFVIDVTFIFRLINVFIEKIGKIHENRNFIRWLIYMAFSSSSKFGLDLFFIPRLIIKCHNNHIDLSFFTWEINSYVRKKINLMHKKALSKIYVAELVNMKIVFLLFLYQHAIFLKYNRFRSEDIQTLRNLIQKTMNSDDCFACIFDDFLKLVKNQSKNLIK